MGKKVTKKMAAKIEEDLLNEDDEDVDSSGNSKDNKQGARGRQDNSLSVLTKKFIELIKNSENMTIDLNVAVSMLKVQKRRIYDITNVLQGISYVEKTQKNTIKWIGGTQDPEVQKEINQLKLRLDRMSEEEKALDSKILELNSQIRKQFFDNDEMRQFHYITYDDLAKIYQTMNKDKGISGRSMIIIAAPKGTSLEMGQEEQGESVLRMDATGKGKIRVYNCSGTGGVKEVELSKGE